MLGVFLLVVLLGGFCLFFFCFCFFDNAKTTPCVMPDPVATYKWSAPVLGKEQTTTKRKQTKRSFQTGCSAFGRWWWRVFSINQSINHSVSLLGRAEIVLFFFFFFFKSLTTAWSFSICGHESRRVVSLVVAMSREELCLQLWPWVEKSCIFSCGHESRRVVSLVVAMSREELCL